MINEILRRHKGGILDGGVPNPPLDVVCQLVGKATASITPNVQRKGFRNTGLTLAIDGSEDGDLSPDLRKLFKDHGQDLTVRDEDIARFNNPQPVEEKSKVAQAFEILCADAAKAKEEEFEFDEDFDFDFKPSKKKKQKREER